MSLQLLVLLGSAGICLLAGEWAWRALVRARHARDVAAFAEPMFRIVPGPELYGLRPGLDRTETIVDPAGGPPAIARYRVNDDGVRWHPVWPPPRDPAVQRVLFVGDSYTFGTAVDDGVAFPHRAEAELHALGVPVFAINAGVPGYNSEQTLAWLRVLLDRHEPQHVVFGFVLNDAEPPTNVGLPPAHVYRGVRSWLLADSTQAIDALVFALVDDLPLCGPRHEPYEFDSRRSWGPGSAKAHACKAAIAAMHATCRARGVGFGVVILPAFTCSFDATYPHAGIHAQIAALAAERGFPALDVLPALRGADATALRVPGDGHPNAEGHRQLAVQIAAWLVERLRG